MKGSARVSAALIALILLVNVLVPMADAASIIPKDSTEGTGWKELSFNLEVDEKMLYGVLTIPTAFKGKLPTVIFLHGMNCTNDSFGISAKYLAAAGIASVRFDFSGNGQSEGSGEDITVTREVSEAEAVLVAAQEIPFVDTSRLFVFGYSLGGLDAVLLGAGHVKEIKALILWSPAFNFTDACNMGILLGNFFDAKNPPGTITSGTMTYGRNFITDGQKLSWNTAARKYTGDVLIIHGSSDLTVPVLYSVYASQIFSHCTLSVYDGVDHDYAGEAVYNAAIETYNYLKDRI